MMIDKGESPQGCIIRENEDLMGYLVKNITKIAEGNYSPACLTEMGQLFIAGYSPDIKIQRRRKLRLNRKHGGFEI